ncbi:MAG TPA: hypothetical protein PKD49_06340 [Hyphomicrobium sp.]|nr:hypothetical protein [Hyphomicrobium sp.]
MIHDRKRCSRSGLEDEQFPLDHEGTKGTLAWSGVADCQVLV